MEMLPLARKNDLVVQELRKETLIYDLKINKAYCLNETLTSVWQACDGKTSFDELKGNTKFTDDLIYLALEDLKKEKLIEGQYESRLSNLSRREVIRKAGLASLVTLPVITSLIAPTVAAAASACVPLGQTCTFDFGAQSECCDTLRCAAFTQCIPCGTPGAFISCALTDYCCSGAGTPIVPANGFCNCN